MENRNRNISRPAPGKGIGRFFLDAITEGILNAIVFVFLFIGWSIRWTLATVFFVGVMLGTAYFTFDWVLSRGEYVTVPDITGRPITEASLLLADKGLECGKQQQMADAKVPKYFVIAQRPSAGKVVRSGRKIFPIVSTGPETLKPPDLLKKDLQVATDEIFRTPFTLGTVARIPHSEPRNTVISQDPLPTSTIVRGTMINLLVSDGSSDSTFLMPDLVGRPVQEVNGILEPLGLLPVPNIVEDPNVAEDIVLEQQPPAGTLVMQSTKVMYSVRPSKLTTNLPNARRNAKVSYTIPALGRDVEIRFDSIDRNGTRTLIYPTDRDYIDNDNGDKVPPRFQSGSTITLPSLSFVDEMTIEIYLDGQLSQTQFFKGDSPPLVTQY